MTWGDEKSSKADWNGPDRHLIMISVSWGGAGDVGPARARGMGRKAGRAIICWILSLFRLQRRQFAFVGSSFNRLVFSAFVNIFSSCIAHRYPSTCDEKVDFLSQPFVAFSWHCSTSFRVLSRYPCWGFSTHACRWFSFIFSFTCFEMVFGVSVSFGSTSKHVVSWSATLISDPFSRSY